MAQPRTLVLKEHGTNCEEESRYAFERAGAKAEIVHMEDLIRDKSRLREYQILMWPGGFSYGDDTGSGLAWANRIRDNLWEEILDYVNNDNLVLGVCNGFQVMAQLGLFPTIDSTYGEPQVAVTHNTSARFIDRWVDVEVSGSDRSPWLDGIDTLTMPIAHGEGRFYASDHVLKLIQGEQRSIIRYAKGQACEYQSLPANPNGSVDDIAGLTDLSGRVLGMMPHPERAMEFTQLPDWPLQKEKLLREGKELPKDGPGLKIFKNAVKYFK